MDCGPPVLPPELEREIFEICALSRPVSIPKLMLIAQRVKDWVEPLLYRTMAVDYGRPVPGLGVPDYTLKAVLAAIHTKPPAFFPHAVRNLMLCAWYDSTADELSAVETILRACTSVENLSVPQIPDALIPLVACLPLKHLYASCKLLLRALPPTDAFFSRLTHIELEDVFEDKDDVETACTTLTALPHLTHVSFTSPELIPICPRLLKSCMALRVLICFLHYALDYSDENHAHAPTLVKDVRFVVMGCGDLLEEWYAGVRHSADYWTHGADYWRRAEIFIAKRRAREIDPLQYEIPRDASKAFAAGMAAAT